MGEISCRLHLLGTIQVEKEGRLVRNFESRKSLALLGYLSQQEQPVLRSHLAGLFWGDKSEARGRRNLSHELSLLSNLLSGCFEADYHSIQFKPSAACWVDTIAFTQLAASYKSPNFILKSEIPTEEAKVTGLAHLTASPLPSLPALVEAVALYQGDFMAGYYLDGCPEFETWLVREQEIWRRRMVEALEKLIAHYVLHHQDDQAQTYIRRWLELEPWREEAHYYLMLLLARSGQRSAALAQYEICRRALTDELGVEPAAETLRLYEQVRAGKVDIKDKELKLEDNALARSSILHAPSSPSTFLTLQPTVPLSTTPFIGREEELAEITERLANPACRLLTLVGPGGIGKTRLAIQAARQLIANLLVGQANGSEHFFAQGVYFIDLDPLSSADFLVATIADALHFSFYSGSDPTQQLLNYLHEKQMLLVLDNFEHLLTGVHLIADILKHAPDIKILAISRERLNLQEEWILPIQGLRVPTSSTNSPLIREQIWEGVEEYSSIQLFLQQAQAINPGFSLSEQEKPYVIHICQLVEGIPLAIELAAAWVRLLSCREIAQEIEQNLDFLTTSLRNVPERHRSLRAVFDHSWQLLSVEEKRVFRQLAVFRGGCQREAAERVTGASLPLLLALVDKSLLRPSQSGRYIRHDLLWQYANEKLAELPQEKEQMQELHCDYYAAFLQQREVLLVGGKQQEALAEIGAEIENVRTGWQWAIGHQKITAIEQALSSLFHFYDMRSWFQEGAEAFGQAAASLIEEGVGNLKSKIILAKLLARQGWFTFQLGQPGPAKVLLQESLALLRSLNQASDARREMVFALNYLGAMHRHLGEYALAKQQLQESRTICQVVDDQFGLSIALNILNQVAYLEGDYIQARQLAQESLRIKQQIGDRRGITFSLNILGQVAYALTEYGEAKQFFQESLAICQEMGDRRGVALCLNYLGNVAQMLAAYSEAQHLYGEGLAIFKEIGNQWGLIVSHTKLGHVASILEEYQAARGHFVEALKMAMAVQAVPAALEVLLGMVTLLTKTREMEQEQALEILALVLNHPASDKDNQNQASRLLAMLAPRLPVRVITTTQARVQAKPLEVVVKELLRQESN